MIERRLMSSFLRLGKRSSSSGANICSILAAVAIMVTVPMKPSSASRYSRSPVQKLPPTRLAMTFEV